jgi:hemerythrin
MTEYRCPAAAANKASHDRFAQVLAGFLERYAASGFDRTEARNLVDTMDHWLAEHICRIDVRLKERV